MQNGENHKVVWAVYFPMMLRGKEKPGIIWSRTRICFSTKQKCEITLYKEHKL